MKRDYGTAEACKLFNISKSTLFRWERDGVLRPVARDHHNHRRYDPKQVSEVVARKARHRYESVADRPELAITIIEENALAKLTSGDESGLCELAELDVLSCVTIKRLIQLAEAYEPDDTLFTEILRVGHLQSARLSSVTPRSQR